MEITKTLESYLDLLNLKLEAFNGYVQPLRDWLADAQDINENKEPLNLVYNGVLDCIEIETNSFFGSLEEVSLETSEIEDLLTKVGIIIYEKNIYSEDYDGFTLAD